MSKGMNDRLKDDVEKFKRYRNRDGNSIDLPTAMEYTFWTLALLSVGFMIGSMFFVGPDKLITGQMWLALSLGGICLFGGLAIATRMVGEI